MPLSTMEVTEIASDDHWQGDQAAIVLIVVIKQYVSHKRLPTLIMM